MSKRTEHKRFTTRKTFICGITAWYVMDGNEPGERFPDRAEAIRETKRLNATTAK